MDETAKTEARNYLSAAGFFLIAAYFLVMIFPIIGSNTPVSANIYVNIAMGIGLLIIATLLIVLRKRDMISILFFILGFFQLFLAFTSTGFWMTILMGFLVLASLVLLVSKEKVKWLLFIIPAIMFVNSLVRGCFGYNTTVFAVFLGIITVISLYYAFCCASERISLPGRKLLTADEATDFKASGSVLGYMLFALIFAVWAIFNFAGDSAALPVETTQTIELLCGALMIFVAVLLLAVGKMRFTPVMFLLMGITAILGIFVSGYMYIGLGILYLVIGLFAILRKESRILPGIMLLFAAAVYFIVGAVGAAVPAAALAVVNAAAAVIAVYLAFVVYSQRKLPKF
ncbi:MAG TPA: hypothetical protein O0X97_06230 [Methanocorpusculum sp.]|nr:hypothetical protein [Methanocorpusculum sp.]